MGGPLEESGRGTENEARNRGEWRRLVETVVKWNYL